MKELEGTQVLVPPVSARIVSAVGGLGDPVARWDAGSLARAR